MAMAKKPVSNEIVVPRINLKTFAITLVGDSPLICHAWGSKAKQMILDKNMKKPKQAKEAYDPQQAYLDSLYPMPDGNGYGFPAIGLKGCAVSACRFVDGIPMTMARGAFHIAGELIKIDGTPHIRQDMVRIGMGTADIRHRGEFTEWSILLPITYNASALSPDQVVNLFNVAGFGVGIGEWRPETNGSYGRFHVA